MRTRILCTAAVLCAALALSGCPMFATNNGGLEASDFEQISLSGFDAADNAADHNDYAWAMEYFEPDGKAQGHLYVGTGNNMLGLVISGIATMAGDGELAQVSIYPPEIRRYRPDVFIREWERVFDWREEEAPDFKTIGVRFLKTYRAQSDGVNYLYAATFGHEAKVLRSATGDAGSWEVVWESGTVGSVRWMEIHGGLLYVGTANDLPVGEKIGKIWYTDGATFMPYMEDGFGNPKNSAIMSLISYNGYLYAGTQNQDEGFEIWKMLPLKSGTADPADKCAPVQVLSGGGNDSANESAIMPCIYNGDLYYGTMIYPHNCLLKGFKGAEILRIHT
ncbi:MAG: hypothetical protein GY851_09120, partial [bacterium]|nr:hypothetical protein [bacterium]